MNILCLCAQGLNRSKFLANYLREQGHETDFAGVSGWTFNKVTQGRIDWADVIVVVRPQFKEVIEQEYAVHKRIIVLDGASGEEDTLLKQLVKFLPLN